MRPPPPTAKSIRESIIRGDGEGCIFPSSIRSMIDGLGDSIRLDIDPDYQRAHVWTLEQSAAFVGHKLEGGECPTLTIQRWPVSVSVVDELVDGKQRLLAILGFIEGRVPALLTDGHSYFIGEWPREDQQYFSRSFELMLRAKYVSCRDRAEVLRLYLKLNRGGSVHTDAEIERVRALLAMEAERDQPEAAAYPYVARREGEEFPLSRAEYWHRIEGSRLQCRVALGETCAHGWAVSPRPSATTTAPTR